MRTDSSVNQTQFENLFAQSSRTLWCIAAGVLGDADQAEDVLQEAAMIAYQKCDQFDAETSFVAWTGRIVRFVALNTRRRGQRRKTTPVNPAVLEHHQAAVTMNGSPAVNATGDLQSDQQYFDDRLQSALQTLSPTARACLLLRTVMDMPYREIARVLDLPEGTAMSHVHRARAQLRHMIADETNEDSSGGGRTEPTDA